jgi:hypothetical protein
MGVAGNQESLKDSLAVAGVGDCAVKPAPFPSATVAPATALTPMNDLRSRFLSDISGSGFGGGGKMEGGGEACQRAIYFPTDD